MIRWLKEQSLAKRLTFVNCLFVLALTALLWYTMFQSMQTTAMQTLLRESELRFSQSVIQTERLAEMCNTNTQVFLNTPALVAHLEELAVGDQQEDALKLMQFYRNVIGSLEKIVLSNLDMYQIRVYSVRENIHEMMPILYGADRMTGTPWESNAMQSGKWYFDFTDSLFMERKQADHLMCLVTNIVSTSGEIIGVLEVLVRMDEALPALFSSDGRGWSMLIDHSGHVLAGEFPSGMTALPEIAADGVVETVRIGPDRMLAVRQTLKGMDCDYLQLTSLADIDAALYKQALILLFTLLTIFVLISYATSRMIRQVLKGVYVAFDGMRAFASGDIDARLIVTGHDEAADFAREVNGLMDSIRQLMQNNLEREVQAQHMELRALHNQINAHFIYNVLEAIKMMAEIDEKYDIADAMTSLGKLLRYSMKWESRNVHLSKEIDYIRNYLTLMNLRFDYVVKLNLEMPEELYSQRIPKISLQPIVENAVVHGGAILTADTTISIIGTIDHEHECCKIAISDEGQGMDLDQLEILRKQIDGTEPKQSSSGNGIGLHNVHSRIQRTFGSAYGLTVESLSQRGTTVTVILPYREKEEQT